jgi:aspartate/tyrosine/aromatic aminotransferase
MYSNPPVHGARIVANIVGDPTLFGEWKAEMEMMAGRIKTVRQELYDNISSKDKSGKDWSFILKQIGMFSFTGLNKNQVIHSPFDFFHMINLWLFQTLSFVLFLRLHQHDMNM